MAENLKLHNERIQLMRHQSDNRFRTAPKLPETEIELLQSYFSKILTRFYSF